MIIKPARIEDLKEIHSVQLAGHPESLHEDISLFTKIIEQQGSVCLISLQDNQITAYILGYPTSKDRADFETGPQNSQNPNIMYLHDLCVHPDFQKYGIGNHLYKAFEIQTQKSGFKGIIATAIDGRLSFWEKQGFKATTSSNYRGISSTKVEKYF